jgi:microcystin-dependent protein
MAQITYDDKVDLNTTQVADINKVKASDMNEIKETVNVNTPTGIVSIFAGTVAPDGWLICDGSEISRSTYSDLFNVIGTTYGDGDGSTTFNLPNLKGRVPVGLDTEDTDFDGLGDFGGEKTAYTFLRPAANAVHMPNGSGPYGNRIITSDEITSQTSEFQDQVSSLQPYIVMNYIISY